MLTLTLHCALAMLQAQFAPVDVPKEHWAFPAVDALFREGLLKGYPAEKQPVLVLDRKVKKDQKMLRAWMSDWKVRGLLVGYPDLPGHTPPDGPYSWAVAVHAMWSNMTWDSTLNQRRTAPLANSLPSFPKLAQAISMLEPELTALGGDPRGMIKALNDLNSTAKFLFAGGK